MKNTACFTGHRPKDLNGYNPMDNIDFLNKSTEVCIDLIENYNIDTFYNGMAQGYDMWMARIILGLKQKYPHIKLICAIPCKGQWQAWIKNPESVYEWLTIYEEADKIEYVSEGYYTKWCLPTRNKYMVDRSSYTIAGWNGKTSGGTWDCLKYARKKERKVITVHPKSLEVKYEFEEGKHGI